MTIHAAGDFGDFSLTIAVSPPPWYQNCYIVQHRPSGEIAIIDPGGDAPQIINAASKMGGTPVAIWLTHGHPDHLGAARAIEQGLNIPTIAHTEEKPVIERASDLNKTFTGQGQDGPADLHWFEGEPDFSLGGATVKVIFTPGHTPGGVCFDFGDFVVTGDTLFRHGVGRTDLPGGSEAKLWDSITRLLGKVGESPRLYSGHGPDWGADEARRWWRMMA
ncbi:MBL fold metallo-hydrolase [Magnetospirillum gryphiswaldense]|uniref:Metal-binding hydrolase n=2 Tax=Magnetospirillum gryphiswaldense TaxID=55518 RepID=V6F8W5_MAGGM|nr:MBL fold metallo-hydrolase [Magnetospirillum gryphiswaldense]AVM74931.1 putative metallo-hydrolase [Magnetospirillum gryphiswaldense MSR-1]AVM78834.1 putative metallo-hydrolase [Magnetospirillum gryphiswaldense]CAM76973.1 metallo-beta-lactamase family protein [Magnetospirillum gryphiswaldense MSR-1]CDL01181.1 putative metal-binding hydrolase [Magnetospirillum gryphiswaldense MSR-1 v2]